MANFGHATGTCNVIETLLTAGVGHNIALTSYSVDKNGLYTVDASKVVDNDGKGSATVTAGGSIEKVSGTCIDFAGASYYTADDCVFYRVDIYGNVSKTTISAVRDGIVGTTNYSYVAYTVNSDGELTGMYWQTK